MVVVKPELSLEELVALRVRRDLSISVCLPALDEAPTIGGICATCRRLVALGLIQQLIVLDSGSTDGTQEVARAAGAEVYEARDVLAGEAPEPLGKGGALWKSLAVATGDVVVWMDSDTRNFGEHFVTRMLEPLLSRPDIKMTKAFYDRPLVAGDATLSTGGARVTELVFRPLAQFLFPELVDIVQPLSGEYAAYREDLLDLGFFTGYGVETGLMIDFVARHGAGSIAQVDLGARLHDNQDVPGLGRMAFEVIQVLLTRARQLRRLELETEWPNALRQFETAPDGVRAHDHHIRVRELPAMRNVLSTTASND